MLSKPKRPKSLRKRGEKFRRLFDQRDVIYFLHIGKNAGTQFAVVAANISERRSDVRIEVLGHSKKLGVLKPEDKYL